jgi:hypothetical protein
LREQHNRRAAGDYSDTLESGHHGLDGCQVSSQSRGYLLRVTVTVLLSVTSMILIGTTCMSMKAAHESALELLESARTTTSHSPCTHFKSDWFEVISVPKMRHGMTTIRIVSVGSTVVQSGEIMELPECPGKRIQRERHVTIGIKYQPLETWPFGQSREIALDGEQAVCVQHAIDQFKGNLTCDSN